MAETLKEKIEWMLNGGYLTDKGERLLAYSIDLKRKEFYCVDIWAVKHKRQKKRYFDQNLPMEDIDENMEILILQ
ncbi:hypothetical protein ABD91_21515 [Lysinibacillus sphaericus]|uniref:hypothetical protein n=1 Tax=Lysinibacillus sphaericus TaxID=1421 RepID=UPI0018CCF3B4|nr:hypothetical protein [Lysinibacillus sphaericus]MBG9693317.1 hypothetical protein [Lysinibacillus sphaericus]